MESPYSGQLRRGFRMKRSQAASGVCASASSPRREHTCRFVDCHRHGRGGDPATGGTTGGGGESTSDLWQEISASAARSRDAELSVDPERFSSYSLDHDGLAAAPSRPRRVSSRTRHARSLSSSPPPAPRGDFQRFAVVESLIMQPGACGEAPTSRPTWAVGWTTRRPRCAST